MSKKLFVVLVLTFLAVQGITAQAGATVDSAIELTVNEVTQVLFGRIGTERFLKVTAEADGTYYFYSRDKFNFETGSRAPNWANYVDISQDPNFDDANIITPGVKPGGSYYGNNIGYDNDRPSAAPLWFSFEVKKGQTYYIRLENDGADSRGGRGNVYMTNTEPSSWAW